MHLVIYLYKIIIKNKFNQHNHTHSNHNNNNNNNKMESVLMIYLINKE